MLTPWTLEDLTARMRLVLSSTGLAGDAAAKNGQISDVPNARTVRYYTTIGVLDRPASKGRVALYGRRHLEQLVAIKRLQAQGKTLAEVQAALLGLDDAALAALAALPAETEAAAHGPVEKPADVRRERSFWASEPPEPSATPTLPAASDDEAADVSAADVSPGTTTQPVTGIQLDDGVTLAFPAARTLTDDDQKALRAALLEVDLILRARGLL